MAGLEVVSWGGDTPSWESNLMYVCSKKYKTNYDAATKIIDYEAKAMGDR